MSETHFATEFAGQRKRLFGLSFLTALLTILTLGLYRFWMRTRLRRYYWSSVRPGGTPLEYVGEPLEKLLGFLIAVVFLAFYIGIVNLLLMFGSFAVFNGNTPAYLLSFLGVIPLIFYARFRARRYVLARTRWRGIRFGVEDGAWGYAWRAIGHWLLTILTLGLWWPRMTFALEKYRIDRTTYGQDKLHQGGDWAMLYPGFAHLMVGVVFSFMVVLVAIGNGFEVAFAAQDEVELAAQFPRMFWLLLIFVPWAIYGLARYLVDAKRLLANHKRVGPLSLNAAPRAARVLRIYGLGSTIILVIMTLLITAMGVTIAGLAASYAGDAMPDFVDPALELIPPMLLTGIGVLIYFVIFLSFVVLRHTLITLPLWRHYAETLEVHGVDRLDELRQVARDEMEHAEGFAEALDVGAAI